MPCSKATERHIWVSVLFIFIGFALVVGGCYAESSSKAAFFALVFGGVGLMCITLLIYFPIAVHVEKTYCGDPTPPDGSPKL